MAEISDLMDSIHNATEQDEPPLEHICQQITTEMHTTSIAESVTPCEAPSKKGSTPPVDKKPKKKRGNFFAQSPNITSSPKKGLPSEIQMATNLFSLFIKRSTTDKGLNLEKLRMVIGENLSDHTVGHNSREKELTLYDEKNRPVTTFDVRTLVVISA